MPIANGASRGRRGGARRGRGPERRGFSLGGVGKPVDMQGREGRDVTRAMAKLAGAVKAFSYDFRGKVVLDIGASTGGFTQLALERGARKVIAVEKGTRQMMAPLRFDPRVELHEKTDVFEVSVRGRGETEGRTVAMDGSGEMRERTLPVMAPSRLSGLSSEEEGPGATDRRVWLEKELDTIMADVSFVSLRLILVYAKKELAGKKTDYLVMLKPQFEARPEQLNKGVVKNERMRREIIRDFENWLKQNGFVILSKLDNEMVGKNGNRERFYFLRTSVSS